MTTATLDHVDTTPATDAFAPKVEVAPEHSEAEPTGPQSIGHYVAMTVPTSVLLLFAIVAAGIQTQTGNWLHSVEFGVYAAVWIGGGFGFMVGGVMWGLDQVEHDHGD